MLTMLITNLYLIVTAFSERGIFSKSASKYCFIAMKNLLILSSIQNFSKIILHHFYMQSRKEEKVVQVTSVQHQKNLLEATKNEKSCL